jgi:HrpA-like RNA helicase
MCLKFKLLNEVQQNSKSNTEMNERIQEERKQLPIYMARETLIEYIQRNQILIIVGETGSGKTTQLPQYIYECKDIIRNGAIAVTQPRRVAAMSIAKRVSQEMGVQLGEEVGYSIRFEDVTDTEKTVIKYLTDGMLLRESQMNSNLDQYSVIILDEAHERTLHTDILFGVIKRILRKRNDLKVIIMSATLEARSFSIFFNGAKTLYISGRQYPVQVMYCKEPQVDYIDATVTAVLQIHIDEQMPNAISNDNAGDILVFLTGQEEIENVARILEEKSKLLPPESLKMMICPIFASLPSEKQMEVFQKTPPGCRKVILATNIAETSITINGVRFVIDTGFVKAKAYNPNNGLEILKVIPISKASARQRMGRAGREAPGKCFRLYTEETYESLDEFTEPEIVCCNLSTVVLQLKSMGVKNIQNFEFMSSPSKESITKSLQTLYILGAINKKGRLSELGQKMAQFPLDPMFAVALIKSEEFGCTEEILTIISMLSVDSIFYSPYNKRDEANKSKMKFANKSGDHLTMLKVYNEFVNVIKDISEDKMWIEHKKVEQWCNDHFINYRSMRKVLEVRQQLQEYVVRSNGNEQISSCGKDLSQVRKCLCAAFFIHAAVRVPNKHSYLILNEGIEVRIHPSSVIQDPLPNCVIFNQVVMTSREYIRDVCAIDHLWLTEVTPDLYREKLASKATDLVNQVLKAEEQKKRKNSGEEFQVQRSA